MLPNEAGLQGREESAIAHGAAVDRVYGMPEPAAPMIYNFLIIL